MLENLISLVKENAKEAIIDNPAIPNEQNDAACETAATSIFDSLKNMVGNGGLESVTQLLGNNGAAQGSTVNEISGNVAGELMKKFGLGNSAANGIVQSLIPTVIGQLTSKTNDPNDNSFDLQGILGALTGGDTSGIFGKLKGLIGL
ncbi:MAG: hypothetical protein JZU53_17220 [Paludibacter sp.]|nr:hypothetical protein [Paludibacter sp.]